MSDAKQPEHMRPIPDGGLKDAMPSWLKRPPAWRDLPTAEQRHERSLPEPDTSEIDPRSLVDVSDLPQWLQAISARGDIPVPTPDASVDHAVEVIQAARKPSAVPQEPLPQTDTAGSESEPVFVGPGFMPGLESQPEQTPSVPHSAPNIPIWIWPVVALVTIALVITLYLML